MIRRAVSRATGDRGSLPMAMLLILVGVSLSGLLAAAVSAQISGTRATVHSSEALDAAQSGIDVALGQIRLAVTDGAGDPAKLPCGPFTGAVNTATDQSYTVAIFYLRTQPPAGDVGWAQANKMTCTGSHLSGAETPVYVLLSSTGRALDTGGTTAPRTVTATYTMHSTTRENVAGGLVHVLGQNNPDLCFSAPGKTPVAGAPLTLQVCDSNDDRQKFAYVSNLNLVLVASRADGSTGMCLDAAPVHGEQVVFRPCADPTAEQQQWSLNDRANFEGTKNAVRDQQCFHVVSPGIAGSTIVLHAAANDPAGVSQYDKACGDDYTVTRSFQPEAAVGTGGAGARSNQLVNFEQFGRCFDVSGNDVSEKYMVIWPCKQSPNGVVQWNQVWHLPAIPDGHSSGTGVIWLHSDQDNRTYCLSSPGWLNPPGYAPATASYPKLVTCDPTAPATLATTWTRRGATGVFATAYRIETTYGAPTGTAWCLAPTDTAYDYWYTGNKDVSKGTLAVCDGTRGQKWNADPMVLSSAVSDVSEK
ncbi:RICIN domain-containing protein [Nucisporomicrobium flavum]|uniref:RICIN domain-containing protein n=1 Tax=Nucisporomicrobium flavum TaxID=2785915 RepID=UPI0018F68376|nr:RICIN domain-containing protein [Nucisporomicrobium flavum]